MRPPKKSENLEVRLSHQDKTALQDKAAQEGRSVSAVVRALISDYLSQPVARSKHNRVMELLMTLKSKPKSVLAATFACLTIPFALSSFASAGEVSLLINGDYTHPIIEDGVEGKRVRRFETEIHMDSDGSASFEYPSPNGTLKVTIHAEEVETGLSLKFTILDNEEIIGTPKLITNYDVPARIEIGHEQGRIFTLDALPTKL